MSADKFKQLSDAFLKISQGFSEVASIMTTNLEVENIHSAPAVSAVDSADSSNAITSAPSPVSTSVKKVKKEKDPQAPKRPLNAYFLFSRDFRQRSKEDNPKVTFPELTKSINEAWEAIDAETKAKYEAESKVLFEEFNKQMKAYNKTHAKDTETSETKTIEPEQEVETITNPDTPTITITTPNTLPIALPIASSSDEPSSPSQDYASGSQEPKKKKKKNKHNREGESLKESKE